MFVEVSPDLSVCATRIVAIMSTNSFQARETIKAERKAGTLINGAGNQAAHACVFLDNGSVISSHYTVSQIMRLIRRANAKAVKNKGVYSTERVKVVEDRIIPEDDELDTIDESLFNDDVDDEKVPVVDE